MKTTKWGPDDRKALSKLVVRAGGIDVAAEMLQTGPVSIWRWRADGNPRYPLTVRAMLKKYHCYNTGRAK